MMFLNLSRRFAARLLFCATVVVAAAGGAPNTMAQSSLSLVGQLRAPYPQTTLVEPIAAIARTCSSISSLSRRCFFTFYKGCETRGETKEHCTRMSGFCHGCTDAYATCKSDRNAASGKTGSAADCATCNAAYSRCISRMVEQYGGKLVKPQ